MRLHSIAIRVCRLVAAVAVVGLVAESTVRLTAQTAEKWDPAIAKFEASDQVSPPPTNGIVFIGASSIVRWKLPDYFPELGDKAINRGFGGSQMIDSLEFADRIILPYRPRMVVVYAGDNDLAAGKSPEQVLADFQALVRKIHELPARRTW